MRQLKITKNITNRSSESLERYLSEIAKEPRISPEEEEELARRRQRGGPGGARGRDGLGRASRRFVVSVAKQYQHQGISLTDLINEGNVGLVKAAEKFDETRGFKFISYAVWWIRQSIIQALSEKSKIVRVPLPQSATANKVSRCMTDFLQEKGRIPSVQEIMEITGIEERKIKEAMDAQNRQVSIDEPFSDENEGSIADTLASTDDSEKSDNEVDRQSMDSDIQKVVSTVLNRREAYVVTRAFGLGCPEETLEQIGEELGLSRERVRQVKEKALRKIRHSGSQALLQKYLG